MFAPTISVVSATTAFITPPTPDPPKSSTVGGPHLRILLSQPPTKLATTEGSPDIDVEVINQDIAKFMEANNDQT